MDADSTPTYTPSASTVGESRYVFVTHEYRVSLDFLACDMQRHYQNRTDNPSGQHPVNSFPTKDGTGVIEAWDVIEVIRRFAAAVSATRHPSWPERANLAAVARTIGQPYRQVLSAALFDTGYLTDTDTRAPRPYDAVLHDAISVLTEATNLTNQPMRQTSSGQWEADPDPRVALPIDSGRVRHPRPGRRCRQHRQH
jgi:hypothetical protein